MGSRSLQTGGVAVYQAAGELVELAKQRAADLLEADVDDLVVDTDGAAIAVAGAPGPGVTLAQLAEREQLQVDTKFDSGAPTFPFGAHLAVVEVDVESGKAVVSRIVTVDDAGPVLNPLLAEGQRHGGIAQGIAQALLEEVVFDADGNPLTATFADYAFPSAAELPSFELLDMATPTPLNPLGVKGIGEAGTIGATPAVQSAVVDAVSHLGVRHIDMPTSPMRVWDGHPGGRGWHVTIDPMKIAAADAATVRIDSVAVEMTVNGTETGADVEPRLLLAHYLRDVLGLKATNIGCDTTSCGACTVLVDGESVKSCTVLAVQADQQSVTTMEGLSPVGGRAAPGGGGVPRPSTGCSAGSARRAW